jgi:hypothetical protein
VAVAVAAFFSGVDAPSGEAPNPGLATAVDAARRLSRAAATIADGRIRRE